MSVPVNWAGQERGAHIANQGLVSWNFFERKIVVLKSIGCLIFYVVEEVSTLFYTPMCLSAACIQLLVVNYIDLAELLGFLGRSAPPSTSIQIVGCLVFTD